MNIKISSDYEEQEHKETKLRSVLTINEETINILKENGISLDDVSKEILKAQNKTIYKLLCKEKDYKGFYEYVKTSIYKNTFSERIIASLVWEMENE